MRREPAPASPHRQRRGFGSPRTEMIGGFDEPGLVDERIGVLKGR